MQNKFKKPPYLRGLFNKYINKVFIIIKLETLYNHPYKVISAFVLIFFSFLALQGFCFFWWEDAEIYLNIAQILFHDGILYKDAIDTKNIGFLFFWYFMYFPSI